MPGQRRTCLLCSSLKGSGDFLHCPTHLSGVRGNLAVLTATCSRMLIANCKIEAVQESKPTASILQFAIKIYVTTLRRAFNLYTGGSLCRFNSK